MASSFLELPAAASFARATLSSVAERSFPSAWMSSAIFLRVPSWSLSTEAWESDDFLRTDMPAVSLSSADESLPSREAPIAATFSVMPDTVDVSSCSVFATSLSAFFPSAMSFPAAAVESATPRTLSPRSIIVFLCASSLFLISVMSDESDAPVFPMSPAAFPILSSMPASAEESEDALSLRDFMSAAFAWAILRTSAARSS